MDSENAAIYPMIVFYSMDCYPIFERIGYDESKRVAEAAQAFSLIEPLLMPNARGKFSQTELPHFGVRSAPYVAALMAAFIVWSQHEWFDQPYIPAGSMLLQAAEEGYQNWKRFG